MNLRQVLLSLAACAVAAGSFLWGRATGSGTNEARPLPDPTAITQTSATVDLKKAEQVDLASVTIENIAQVDFADAFQLLEKAPPDVLKEWVRRLEALHISPRRTGAIRAFFKTLAQVNTSAAIEQALQMRDGRSTAFTALAGAAPASEIRTLAEAAVGAANSELDATGLVIRWSMYDPVEAARFASAHLEKLDEDGPAGLLENWAAVDPAAAIKWLADVPESRRTSRVYVSFYAGWVEADRAAAVADLAANADDPRRKKAVRNLAVTSFLESVHLATELVQTLQQSGAAPIAVKEIASYSTSRMIMGPPQPEIAPEAAARWLVSLPEHLWADHIGDVVSTWDVGNSTGAVQSWLRTLPWPVSDHVAAKFCAAFNGEQPQHAFDAGFGITDRRLREHALREAVRRMETRDDAEAIMERLQLSSQDAAELKKLIHQQL